MCNVLECYSIPMLNTVADLKPVHVKASWRIRYNFQIVRANVKIVKYNLMLYAFWCIRLMICVDIHSIHFSEKISCENFSPSQFFLLVNYQLKRKSYSYVKIVYALLIITHMTCFEMMHFYSYLIKKFNGNIITKYWYYIHFQFRL